MSNGEYADFADLAAQLAQEVSKTVLDRLGTAAVSRKADRSLVTDADEAAQSHILNAVAERFPDHAFLAEETVAADRQRPNPKTARFCWVVDPLDGTRNFVAGFPSFGTSIAVLEQGRPVVGVIYEHNLARCYAAVIGQGATCNGQPVFAKTPESGFDWLLAVPSSKDAVTVGVVRAWIATRGFVLRNTGSTILHLALVASGVLAGAFAKRTKIWDVAAGALLVQEAGGVVTSPTGQDLFPYSFDSDPNADIPFLAAARAAQSRLLDSIPSGDA
jgi:myo-inositol-1(or 4)-monophosphatase